MTDLASFMNTAVSDAPDAALIPTGAKIRFKITNTKVVTVGEDEKPKLIVRVKPVEIVEWPETTDHAQPADIRQLEQVNFSLMLTDTALANAATHISAKRFLTALEVDADLSWTMALEQALGRTFVALIRRKAKYNSPGEEEPTVAAVVVNA